MQVQHRSSPRSKLLTAITRVFGILFLFIIFGCEGGFNCVGTSGPGTITGRGLYLEDQVAPFPAVNDLTHGETIVVPVSIATLTGENPGDVITVTPICEGGVTATPASTTVTLPEFGAKVYISFVAFVPAGVDPDIHKLGASRTRGAGATGTDPLDISATRSLIVHSNLFAITITPASSNIPRGESRDFTFAILPRGFTQGDVTVNVGTQTVSPNITCSPSQFTVNLVPGSTTPVLQTVTLSTTSLSALGTNKLLANSATAGIAAVPFTIVDPNSGDPTFEITATPLEITTPNGVISTQSVQFTVTSVNGFSGPVKITWVTDHPVSPSPSDNDFQVNVTPTTPATFTRKMYRYATFSNPLEIRFNASDIPFTTTKGVTITVKTP